MNEPEGQAGPAWAALPARRPGATLLIIAAIIGSCIALLTRLEPSGSLTSMFPQRHASARALAQVADELPVGDGLLIMASAARDGDVQRLIDFADRLKAEISNIPRLTALIESVQYRPSAQYREFVEAVVAPSLIYYLDVDGWKELKYRLTRDGMAEQVSRLEALAAAGGAGGAATLQLRDPLRLSELAVGELAPVAGPAAGAMQSAWVSPRGRDLLIQIQARRPVSDMDAVTAMMDGVVEAVGRAGPGDLRIQYGGAYAIAEVAQRSIRADMIASVTGAVVLLQLLFLATYRSLLSFPLAFAPVGFGILMGFAAAALVSPSLSPPTAVIGAILAGLGIDYCVHYLSHYHATPGPRRVERVSRAMAPALLGACSTSVIAFAAVALSDIRALREFAMIGVVGLAGCLLGTLTLLPAVLTGVDRLGKGQGRRWLRWTAEPILRAVADRARVCAILTGGTLLGLAVTAAIQWDSSAVLEPDLHAMHPQPNAALAAQSTIADQFGFSPEPLFVHIEAEGQALVHASHEVRRALESAPNISGSFGLANLLPDPAGADARRLAAGQLDPDAIAADFQAVVEQSVFDAAAFKEYANYLKRILRPGPAPSLEDLDPFPQVGDQFIEGQKAFAVTHVFLRRPLGDRATRDETIRVLSERLRDIPGATLTGMTVLAHDAEQSIYTDLLRLFLLALGMVGAWLLVQFRSVGDAALALLPVAFGAAAVAVGITCGVRLNMVNLIAIPLLIGLGVDYGIFLVAAARRQAMGTVSLQSILAASSHAIIVSALTTGLGFGSLMFTSTPAIRSLGILLAAGVAASLLGAILGLVPLLLMTNRLAPEES